MHELRNTLERIDGRGYKAYKDIQGRTYQFERFRLRVDHVQGDAYAAPSRLRAFVPGDVAMLPREALAGPSRRRATRDFISRSFAAAVADGRDLSIDSGHQTVLDRSACLLTSDGGVELRFRVDLPARGRRILGRSAARLLCDQVPRAVEAAAIASSLDLAELERHCATVEDQTALRQALDGAGLVAFVGDGAVLPRRSGIDERPLPDAIPFASPESLRVTLRAPNAGEVVGMGIPGGVTLIVGGGYHGKSTLLRAVESGIYDHRPGDGRERVVALGTTVKIRAEDGRAVTGVDISPFIDHLPGGRSTGQFTTELASGSTSQAAALVEALESGAGCLLLDEDTSATNFMIRDERMQALVAKTSEPITPFVDRIRELHDSLGVSTILVMGGSGDYFDHADLVLQMDGYRPVDVTRRAREIARSHVTGRRTEVELELSPPGRRRLDPLSVRPERKPGRVKVQARGVDTLVLGRDDVDLRAVEQVDDPSQVRAVGWLLAHLSRERVEIDPFAVLADLLGRLEQGEWDLLSGQPDGDLALPRVHETMAALSRRRGAALR